MSIRHHPDESTLMAYSAGALTEGFNLVVATHLDSCLQCRQKVAEAEALGGELLGELPAAQMSADGLDRVWNLIDQEPADSDAVVLPSATHEAGSYDLPGVLKAYLPQGLSGVHWRSVVPGIRQYVFRDIDSGSGSVRLLSIAPGTSIPQHSHCGSELTLVLKGSYGDEIGRFRSGDMADLDDSVKHQPVADTEEVCICLIATDDRLKFSDMFSRLLQPLVGI